MTALARPRRGLLDGIGAALCLWAAAYHTPAGALVRDLVGRVTSTRTTTRPLLAYYAGGVYDAQDLVAPPPGGTPRPDVEVISAVPAGQALGRGVFATAVSLEPSARAPLDALARRYGLSLESPDATMQVLGRARAELGSEEAAVLAAFAGYDVTAFATRRANAEGRDARLEHLAARLPPSSARAIALASSALMLGTAYGLAWPVAPGTRVTSPFGWRHHPTLGRDQFHTGVDLAVPEGTSVKAVADGVVRRASEDAVNGRVVVIDHGRGVTTAYCHNSVLHVVAGQQVRVGEAIADSGTTGRSTGPHVHYQLELGRKPMDPFSFRGSTPVLVEPAAPRRDDEGRAALKRAFEQFAPPGIDGAE